jgi:hypothetical protein
MLVNSDYSPLDQRHARWLRHFSRCLDLHEAQYRVLLDGVDAKNLALHLSDRFDLAHPIVKPHRGRKPNTGRCEPSRGQLIDTYGEDRVTSSEEHRGTRYPEHPVVRVGNPALVGVVSHEIAHCLVNHADGLHTPGHGRVWVARYDEVARVAEIWTRRSSISPSGNEQGNPAPTPPRADCVPT